VPMFPLGVPMFPLGVPMFPLGVPMFPPGVPAFPPEMSLAEVGWARSRWECPCSQRGCPRSRRERAHSREKCRRSQREWTHSRRGCPHSRREHAQRWAHRTGVRARFGIKIIGRSASGEVTKAPSPTSNLMLAKMNALILALRAEKEPGLCSPGAACLWPPTSVP
jgi:hypothetical protein